ncbi:ATPase, partial [Streptomyces varsoviensis]
MRRSRASAAEQARGNFTPPPRAAASYADARDPRAAFEPPAAGGRRSPRDWRVATRLNTILLLPALVALVFGGLGIKSSLDTWRQAGDAERTARLVRAAAAYGHALLDERDRGAEPLLTGESDNRAIRESRNATDAAKKNFDRYAAEAPGTPGLRRRLAAFSEAEKALPKLRESAYRGAAAGGTRTEDGYTAVQRPLMELANELASYPGDITAYGQTVHAISLAESAASLQRSLGAHLLVRPGPSDKDREAQLAAFGAGRYLERVALGEYTSGSAEGDVKRLRDTLAGKGRTDERDKIADAISAERAGGSGATPTSWFDASTRTFDAYRSIEEGLAGDALAAARQTTSDALRDAVVNAAVVVLALLLALVIAGLMGRSMSRSTRRLRDAAFEVAEQRLPATVDQLSRTEPGRVDTRVAPVPVTTRDEIGEVARAFDQVHREAVRLAAEQALLRSNIDTIFANLSRRNQHLIEGQLSVISGLESTEADPSRLESLFRLDHLATRLRRNGENLLVLSGEEPGRRWDRPGP